MHRPNRAQTASTFLAAFCVQVESKPVAVLSYHEGARTVVLISRTSRNSLADRAFRRIRVHAFGQLEDQKWFGFDRAFYSVWVLS